MDSPGTSISTLRKKNLRFLMWPRCRVCTHEWTVIPFRENWSPVITFKCLESARRWAVLCFRKILTHPDGNLSWCSAMKHGKASLEVGQTSLARRF